ncbi:MAG: hypothetical protein GY718_09805 [Lentisphaerae bacterium]|nr:hypothetical protein [Lentisphaerota bacterium]
MTLDARWVNTDDAQWVNTDDAQWTPLLIGTGSIALPVLIVTGAGSEATLVQGGITLPIITLSIRAYRGSVPNCVVLNTRNFAVSEYLNYGFNSMVRFNGANLIADQNGIYAQDSSSIDNSAYKIKAAFKSGVIGTTVDKAQRLRNAWLNYETDGDVKLTTVADETIRRIYNLPFLNIQDIPGIQERRIKFERGITDEYFDFKVENVNGSDMEIDKLTIMLEPIISRKG